jgi:hypothetical protein
VSREMLSAMLPKSYLPAAPTGMRHGLLQAEGKKGVMGVERRPMVMVGRMSAHAHGGRSALFHGGGGRSLIWNLLAVTIMVSGRTTALGAAPWKSSPVPPVWPRL